MKKINETTQEQLEKFKKSDDKVGAFKEIANIGDITEIIIKCNDGGIFKGLFKRCNEDGIFIESEEKETIYINFGGIKSIQRWALMDIIKDVYTNAEVVNDEANCDYSVKFLKYGTVVDDTYFAIKTKNGDLEIYKNSTGLMIEIIKSKNLLT